MADDADDLEFQTLTEEFQSVLSKLGDDPQLEQVRDEYSKLYEALVKSHDSEKRLMAKCRDLSSELVSNAAKVQSAMNSVRGDETSVAQLQKEVDEAWRLVDQGREQETKLKEAIEDLKQEVARYELQLEEQAELAHTRAENVAELTEQKKELEIERDNLLEEASKLRADVTELQAQQASSEEQQAEMEDHLQQLEDKITARKTEIDREVRKKGALERELAAKRQTIDELQASTSDLQTQLQETQQMVAELQAGLAEKDQEIGNLQGEIQAIVAKNSKLERHIEQSMTANQNAFEDNQQLKQDLKAKEDEVQSFKAEAAKLQKMVEGVTRKLKASEDKRDELSQQRDTLKSEIGALEREIDAAKRLSDNDKKRLDELARSREMLTKKMAQAGKETEVQETLVKMHESSKKTLEAEISAYREEAAKQRNLIFQLEKERDRYISEAAQSQTQAVQSMEEAKVAEVQTMDLKKRLASVEGKLKQQQALYEQVRSDRNVYSKNLLEAQDEIGEMKRKLKILNHQIDQLKEEITAKDASLQREHQQLDVLEQQKVKLKTDADKLRLTQHQFEKEIRSHEADKKRLNETVDRLGAEQQGLQHKLAEVMKHRNSLAGQLLRHQNEIALLAEKAALQKTIIERGEVELMKRQEDARLLKTEIKRLKRDIKVVTKSADSVEELRRELFKAQRELLKERTRCKALEDEVQTPLNVHRWRKLEGSDPATFDMIQKIQALQKRLIQKTDEVVEKEVRLQEKERQYVELKQILARQPGPEVAEQLQVYQQAVKDKNKQLKALASEVSVYQAQVDEFKYEMERLGRELQETKKKYFDQKKKERQKREKSRALQATMTQDPGVGTRHRVAGAGFNMTGTLSS
eukprot:m.359526 g.359526  ORF g.359526 m.359526 type:complete len:867 (-) comp18604_c0_seq1:381-2981(-)